MCSPSSRDVPWLTSWRIHKQCTPQLTNAWDKSRGWTKWYRMWDGPRCPCHSGLAIWNFSWKQVFLPLNLRGWCLTIPINTASQDTSPVVEWFHHHLTHWHRCRTDMSSPTSAAMIKIIFRTPSPPPKSELIEHHRQQWIVWLEYNAHPRRVLISAWAGQRTDDDQRLLLNPFVESEIC